MLVYPAPGLRVRDPATHRFVPDEGLEVSETDLEWARIIAMGDVVLTAPAAPPSAPAAKPSVTSTPSKDAAQ